ncbi:MAG: histidine ammonia-lyase [Cyclobacteriaceae bacterium]|nr:histidine ammonia-lyase [Cyclobacteriaceae bacterium]
MKIKHTITSDKLTLTDLEKIAHEPVTLELSDDARKKITRCREYLDNKIKNTSQPVYGINTGFGSLYNTHIAPDQLEKLQENLVKSHACGAGPEVPEEIVRLMLFLKVQSLSYGYSGVQVETVQRLTDYFNLNIYPVIYQMGSLGASGDLAPLAHLALTLIGDGEVSVNGERKSGKQINSQMNWEPVHFKAKEGLALLNGTQFMSAYGVWCLLHAKRLLKLSNLIAALSLDAFDGRIEPFLSQVHAIRPQHGQGKVAQEIAELLQDSELIRQPKKHVQDPYSFRCIPQVHGASWDAAEHVGHIILTEVNSVTDNPLIFPDDDLIISGGNFHGQPLALSLDYLAIAVAELGNISERRTYQLISGSRNLPNYLVANPGINSGMMIPQYTAASLVSQNKQLCTPASVDSIVSSNGQEDHVSMGANAATKAYRVVNNAYTILAIELITAAQAIHFRRPLKSSAVLESLLHTFREHVPFVEEDRVLHQDIVKAEEFIREYALV